MVNTYRKGRIAEKKITNWLKEHRFSNIRRSKGSRGPYDVYARSPSGVKTYIQVKSGSAKMSSEEKEKLRKLARKRGGFAAYVYYYGGGKVKLSPLGNWSKKKR